MIGNIKIDICTGSYQDIITYLYLSYNNRVCPQKNVIANNRCAGFLLSNASAASTSALVEVFVPRVRAQFSSVPVLTPQSVLTYK